MKSQNPIALITGASSGIGYEFSKLFAKNGYDLVLIARNKKKLEEIKKDLSQKYNVAVLVISKNLKYNTSANEIYAQLKKKNIKINTLVNNAGFNVYGTFAQTDIEKEIDMINVNLISLTKLTHLILKDMIKTNSGKILNLGSTGSYVSGPNSAVYFATKAYVLSFSYAIAEELKNTKISVTTLCPGPTATNFAKNSDMENSRLFRFGNIMTAEKVAKIGYNALMKRKRSVISGVFNNLQIFLTRFASRKLITKIVGFTMKKQN